MDGYKHQKAIFRYLANGDLGDLHLVTKLRFAVLFQSWGWLGLTFIFSNEREQAGISKRYGIKIEEGLKTQLEQNDYDMMNNMWLQEYWATAHTAWIYSMQAGCMFLGELFHFTSFDSRFSWHPAPRTSRYVSYFYEAS